MSDGSVRLVKEFTYRGGVKQFSNRYHFNFDESPVDHDWWVALFDAMITYEKNIYTSAVTIVRGVAYNPDSDVPVASKAYTTAGILSTSSPAAPGDCVAVLRHGTEGVSNNNHPIFCHSFFHGVHTDGSVSNGDTINFPQKQQIDAWGAVLVSGLSFGTATAVRCTPSGEPVTGHLVDPYIGHRDFPR